MTITTNFDSKSIKLVDQLFEDYNLVDKPGEKIVKGRLHPIIMQEIYNFLAIAIDHKNHPLSFLKQHYNAGKNSYQISVSISAFENSFTFPYLTLLGERVFSCLYNIKLNDLHRKISVNRHLNHHFDGYDFWFNFAEKGSSNPLHRHSGKLSSVIYVNNTEQDATVFEDGFTYYGIPGDIIIFDSLYGHYVKEKKSDGERITASCNFNLNKE